MDHRYEAGAKGEQLDTLAEFSSLLTVRQSGWVVALAHCQILAFAFASSTCQMREPLLTSFAVRMSALAHT